MTAIRVLALMAVCGSTLLVGCSAPTSMQTTGQATPPATFTTPDAIVIATCYSERIDAPSYLILQGISAADGAETTRTETLLPRKVGGCVLRRSRFSKDFSYYAFQLDNLASAETKAVALRLSDGAILPPSTPSQEYDSSADERQPMFHPETDELWFYDRNRKRMRARDVATGQTRDAQKVPAYDEWPTNGGDTRPYQLQPVVLPLGDPPFVVRASDLASVPVSPDGQLAVVENESQTWLASRKAPATEWRSFRDAPYEDWEDKLPLLEGQHVPCTGAFAWITRRTLACTYQADVEGQIARRTQLGVMTFNEDGTKVVSLKKALLPVTDRKVDSLLASPDGKSIAFVSQKGMQENELFRVPVDGSTGPVKIADLFTGLYSKGLLAWN